MIESITEASLLYDFYGQLLTSRKRQVMELYHEENLSLSEIAAEFSISRAAVHDSLKSAEKNLLEYEEKLGLVAEFTKSREAVRKIDSMIDEMCREYADSDKLVAKLQDIKSVISGLER